MVDLSFEKLDQLIRDISNGQKFCNITDDSGEDRLLLFKHPTPLLLELAEVKYKEAYKVAQQEGLMSVSDMEKVIARRGLFTAEDEQQIEDLQKKIEAQKVVLSKTTRVPARRERIKNIISNLEDEIATVRLKKDRNFEITAERKASEEKYLFLTRMGVYDPFTEAPYWPTEIAFNSELNIVFRKRVYLEYIIFSHGVSSQELRSIARSNLWRIRYVTALKTSDSLFNRPISEYTPDQLMLLYWSHYYQSIYEMLPDDRPEDSVIEDDEALDAYMKDWQAQRSRDNAAARANKGKNNSAWDHAETIVMRSNDMYEDIEYTEPTLGRKNKGSVVKDAAPMGRNKS